MCGRYTLRASPADIREMFALFRDPEFRPRYNIAPTTQVVAVRLVEPSKVRQADMLRWGLVPFWAKDPKAGPPLINARADTVRTKPSFRSAFKARRCLVPMSGFSEWSTIGKAKQPYHVTMCDEKPFAAMSAQFSATLSSLLQDFQRPASCDKPHRSGEVPGNDRKTGRRSFSCPEGPI